MADGRYQFIIQRDKQSFCGMVFSEARLVRIEKGIRGEVIVKLSKDNSLSPLG